MLATTHLHKGLQSMYYVVKYVHMQIDRMAINSGYWPY